MNQEWLEHQVVPEIEIREERSRYWLNLAKLSACVACLLYLLGLALPAQAEPIARASVNNGQVVIFVHSEDCALTNVVSNLPKRATWVEGGKTYEGCVGLQPQAGVAMFYFLEDKTVAIVPLQMFQRVVGA